MSQNGPKTKSGEVKFFKIDPEGEIKTAYPDQTPPPTEPEPLWNSDATPVEWKNEPQPNSEPAPLWSLDPANESKEPSIALEKNPVAPEPASLSYLPNADSSQAHIITQISQMPGHDIGDDSETLHQHNMWEHTQPGADSTKGKSAAPAVILEAPPEQAAPSEEAVNPFTEPQEAEVAPVVLEDWQEADLQNIHRAEIPVDAEPEDEVQMPSISALHQAEYQEESHEEEVAPEAERYADPQAVDPGSVLQDEREFSGTDLTARMQSQMDLLQKQVRTIHGLGPEKKLNDGQIEVLRKYIALKEAESRDLLDQKRQYQTFLQKLDGQIKTFAKKNQHLVLELDSLKVREETSRRDLLALKEKYKEDIAKLKADHEQKNMQAGKMTTAVADFDRKREEWKTKIREELKHIRLKEKELENKYELLKRDTQALLDSKDQHVLELKRKNDALELEMDTLEDKLRQSNTLLSQMDAKKKRLIETLKLAQALLEQLDKPDSSSGSGGNTSNGA